MKKIISMSMFLMLLTFLTFGHQASANDDLKMEKENVIELTADDNSEIILDSVQISNENNDENYLISIRDTRVANGVVEEYDLYIDSENNTYQALKTENNEYTDDSTEERALARSGTLATNTYLASVSASTMDPAVIELTKTVLSLRWKDNNGSLSYDWRGLSTWAANPSSLNTNWYLSWTKWGNDPTYFQSVTAEYVNYDFLGGAMGTTFAKTYIYIGGQKGGKYNYTTDLTTTGEAGKLLWLRVKTN
ncbi:hypothetical protein ACTHO0_26460 [Cytobacillus praedii]|uniref:hypothetical protein n=1 Tax=Cytobacillus praedii TaxID=1742358 RepID=UPI003F80DC32